MGKPIIKKSIQTLDILNQIDYYIDEAQRYYEMLEFSVLHASKVMEFYAKAEALCDLLDPGGWSKIESEMQLSERAYVIRKLFKKA